MVLSFPSRGDARIAADIRKVCASHHLSPQQTQRAMGRFLHTLLREHRSNGVAAHEALKLVRYPAPVGTIEGGAA